MEVILAEFGCEAMNTFTALEIARGYVVAHPHMFDVIQVGGHIGALAERDCAGTCPLLRPIVVGVLECSSCVRSHMALAWNPVIICPTSSIA